MKGLGIVTDLVSDIAAFAKLCCAAACHLDAIRPLSREASGDGG